MKKIFFGICFLLSIFCVSANQTTTVAQQTQTKSVKTTKKTPVKKITPKVIKKVPSNKHNKRKDIPKKVLKK